MCQTKRPKIMANPEETKEPIPFKTPEELSGDNTSATMRAGASGRDQLRTDVVQPEAPTENDQTVDYVKLEKEAKAKAEADAYAEAERKKRRIHKKQRQWWRPTWQKWEDQKKYNDGIK